MGIRFWGTRIEALMSISLECRNHGLQTETPKRHGLAFNIIGLIFRSWLEVVCISNTIFIII
jgi:hypothetical protein